jgi:hypothetical protein
MRLILILILATSCGPLKFVGNPAPDMKTVHMSTYHWNYTQAEYEAHPDYDCSNKPTTNESNNRR